MCLAALLHVGLLAANWNTPSRFLDPPDSTEYLTIAGNVASGHGFSQQMSAPFAPDLRRTPIYPGLLAILFTFFGRSIHAAVILNVVIALAGLALMAAGARPFGPTAVALTALLTATDLTSLVYHQLVLTETVFTFLVTAALVVWCRRPQRIPVGIAVGLLLGVATLCRPIGVLLSAALAPAYLLRAGSEGWRAAGREYITLVAMSGVLPVLWVLRNYLVAGALTLTTVGAANVYLHRAAYVQATLSGEDVEAVRSRLQEQFDRQTNGWAERDKIAWLERQGGRVVTTHPGAYVTASLNSLRRTFAPDRETTNRVLGTMAGTWRADTFRAAGWLHLLVLYALVVVGMVRGSLRREMRYTLCAALSMVLYFVLVGGPETYARFRVPMMPMLTLVAGLACGTDGYRRIA